MFDLLNAPRFPSRKDRIDSYLDTRASATSPILMQEFELGDKPMATTAIMIPVAIHQDASLTEHAMGEYAKQQDCDPFTIFLLLNSPADATYTPDFERGIEQAERIQQAFTDMLDIRLAHMRYDKPAIGTIRKDLWDATLQLATDEGRYDVPGSEVIGINHDIDTEHLGPHYISVIQQHYSKAQSRDYPNTRLDPVFSQSSHVYPFDTHPNTAKALFWNEMASRQSYRVHGGGFEAGFVIPLSEYATRGGYQAGVHTHETASLIRPSRDVMWPRTLARTVLKTSPRRFIDRFPKHGYDIWSNDSFGADDDCRKPNVYETSRDATGDELLGHIQANLDHTLNLFYRSAIEKSYGQLMNQAYDHVADVPTRAETIFHDEVSRSFRLAQHVLGRTLKLQALAAQVGAINTAPRIRAEVEHLKEHAIIE